MSFHQVVALGHKHIGAGHPPYVIAEMACAHNGEVSAARKLVDAADAAGADAIQLQFFVPEHTVTPHHEAHAVLQEIAFSEAEWTEVFSFARTRRPHVWVCTYDVPSVALAVKLGADGIKLNSADLSNPEVLVDVARSRIPFTLGTGASSQEEIERGLQTASDQGARDVVLMHGVQNFPTAIDELNISRLAWLRQTFAGLPVGYADHTSGDDPFSRQVDLIALGVGADVIEKHICLDRGHGIDSQAALEPDELSAFVETVRTGYRALASPGLSGFTKSDLRYRRFQKKSIVAARDIAIGETLCRADVAFLRNDTPGIPPIDWEARIAGRRTSRRIAKHENITPDMVEQ